MKYIINNLDIKNIYYIFDMLNKFNYMKNKAIYNTESQTIEIFISNEKISLDLSILDKDGEHLNPNGYGFWYDGINKDGERIAINILFDITITKSIAYYNYEDKSKGGLIPVLFDIPALPSYKFNKLENHIESLLGSPKRLTI